MTGRGAGSSSWRGGGQGREPHHRGLCAQPGRGHHPGQLVEAAARRRVRHGPAPAAWMELGRGDRGDTICCASSSGSHRSRSLMLAETFVSTQLSILSARSLL